MRRAGLVLIAAMFVAVGAAVPASAGILISPATGYSISWNGNDGLFFNPANPATVPANLATTPGVTAFGSSEYGAGVHLIAHAKDGIYGNSNSWLANPGDGAPFIGLNLGGSRLLTGIAWSRDNGNNVTDPGPGGQLADRALGNPYTVQYTTVVNPGPATTFTGNPHTGWANIGTLNYQSDNDAVTGGGFTSYFRHQYGIALHGSPVQATGIRITPPNNSIAIDEIELLQSTAPAPVPQSGLKSWLRADAGLITNTGGSVQTWTDQSGSGNNATPGISPSVVDKAWSGLPTVRFNGATQHLNLPATSALGIVNSDYEMFIVARSGSGNIQFLSAGAFGSGVAQYELHLNGSAGARFIPNNTGTPDPYADIGAAGAYTNGRPQVFGVRVEGNTGIVRVAGVDSVDTVTGARSLYDNWLTLGVRGDASFPFIGDIAEVLVYNRTLTPAERAGVEKYLNDKWNWAMTHVTAAPAGGVNVAPRGTAFAKDVIPGYAAHTIAHLNDGQYGNSFSWIGNSDNSFAGVSFDGSRYDIDSIAISRDNTGAFSDRTRGTYTFQYTTDSFAGVNLGDAAQIDALNWVTIGVFDYDGIVPDATPWTRHLFTFDRVLGATGVRVLTDSPDAGNRIAIDEIEINAVPEPASLALLAMGGLALLLGWRRRR